MKTAAHVAETVALHLPIIRKVYNRIAPSVTPVASSSSSSSYSQNSREGPNGVTQRRLATLEGHALPLVFTGLPPPAAPETIMQRAQGMSVRLEQWQARNAQTKADRNRELLAIAEGRESVLAHATMSHRRPQNERESSWMQRAWEARQARRLERDAWRARRKLMRGRQPKSLQNKVQIADRLEYNATKSLLWVVLLTAEQGTSIFFLCK